MNAGLYKKISIILVSLIISLIFVEIFLRAFVIKPWKNISINDPSIFKPDPILGWLAKKGTYEFLPADINGEKFTMSFNDSGNRKNGNFNNNSKNKILIIGGSFAQGWGVNDKETFSFKLQKKYKNYKIYNFGQGGYGTIQSYLLLKDKISNNIKPKLIIYGIIQHHEYRNIAHAGWLKMLAQYSNRGHVYTPYGSIGKNNKLTIHKPIGYLNLPLREMSSIITLIEKVYMKLSSRDRVYIKSKSGKKTKQQSSVTKKTILKMKNFSEQSGSDFILVNLDWSGSFKKENYENFFKKNGIKFVNCALPSNEKYILPSDYHPNETAHTYFKDCLADYIDNKKILSY